VTLHQQRLILLPLPYLHGGWARPMPHLPRDWARPAHICTGTGLNCATSAPGLGSTVPHLHRDWAQLCHICTGTGLTPATSAPRLGSPRPHLHRDWAQLCHICTGTGLTPCHIFVLGQQAPVSPAEVFTDYSEVLREHSTCCNPANVAPPRNRLQPGKCCTTAQQVATRQMLHHHATGCAGADSHDEVFAPLDRLHVLLEYIKFVLNYGQEVMCTTALQHNTLQRSDRSAACEQHAATCEQHAATQATRCDGAGSVRPRMSHC
jgi:hypothetical protein